MDSQPDNPIQASPTDAVPEKKKTSSEGKWLIAYLSLGFFLAMLILLMIRHVEQDTSPLALCVFGCALLLSLAAGMCFAGDTPRKKTVQTILFLSVLLLPIPYGFLPLDIPIWANCLFLCLLTFLFSATVAGSYASDKKIFKREFIFGPLALLACTLLFHAMGRPIYSKIAFFVACFSGYLFLEALLQKRTIAIRVLRSLIVPGIIAGIYAWTMMEVNLDFSKLEPVQNPMQRDDGSTFMPIDERIDEMKTILVFLGNKTKFSQIYYLSVVDDPYHDSRLFQYVEQASALSKVLLVQPKVYDVVNDYISLMTPMPEGLLSADIIFMDVSGNNECPTVKHWILTDFLYDFVPRVQGETLFVFRVPTNISTEQLSKLLATFPCKPTFVRGSFSQYLLFRKNEPDGPVLNIEKSVDNLAQSVIQRKNEIWSKEKDEDIYSHMMMLHSTFMETEFFVKWWQRDSSPNGDALAKKLLDAEKNTQKYRTQNKSLNKMLLGIITGKLYLYGFVTLIVLYLILRYFIAWQPWHKPMFLSVETGFSLAFTFGVMFYSIVCEHDFSLFLPGVALIAMIFFIVVHDNPKKMIGKHTLVCAALFCLATLREETTLPTIFILLVLPLFNNLLTLFEVEYPDIPHKNRFYALTTAAFALALPVSYVYCMVDAKISEYLVTAMLILLILRFHFSRKSVTAKK